VTLAATVAIELNVPLVPVFRSILKPSSLLELSAQAIWSSAAPASFCHPKTGNTNRKIQIRL
jgi:hypothetical protein